MHIDAFGAPLKARGIGSGSGVPCSYFTPLVNYMGTDPALDYLPAASEGEAVAIAAGMVTAGRPAFALMQNSGLGNAVNPITSMLYIYGMPVQLLVSHRGQPGVPDEPQHERMGQITEELVRLCGIECHVLDPASFARDLDDVMTRGVPAGWVVRKDSLSGGPDAPARKLTMRTGNFALPAAASYEPEMGREDALRLLLPFINHHDAPAVISTTGKQSRELFELDDRGHDRNNRFYMVGSMGCAAGFGLGVARGHDGGVLVVDGDGALLMKLGTLVTIGASRPKNFHHVVIDNGAHDSTGGQWTASPHMDTAAIALACGYRKATTVSSASGFQGAIAEHLASDGPTLLRMVVHPGARKDLGRPSLSPQDGYRRFAGWLGERARGARR